MCVRDCAYVYVYVHPENKTECSSSILYQVWILFILSDGPRRGLPNFKTEFRNSLVMQINAPHYCMLNENQNIVSFKIS